jgi:putative intracellular protease/amidase
MADQIYAEAGKAIAEEGLVFLDGPDGIAISLTPDAAEETGRELIRAAAEARDQAADAK